MISVIAIAAKHSSDCANWIAWSLALLAMTSVERPVAMAQRRCHAPAANSGGPFMRRIILSALLTACAPAAFAEPTPKEQLLVPPQDAAHFVVVLVQQRDACVALQDFDRQRPRDELAEVVHGAGVDGVRTSASACIRAPDEAQKQLQRTWSPQRKAGKQHITRQGKVKVLDCQSGPLLARRRG